MMVSRKMITIKFFFYLLVSWWNASKILPRKQEFLIKRKVNFESGGLRKKATLDMVIFIGYLIFFKTYLHDTFSKI